MISFWLVRGTGAWYRLHVLDFAAALEPIRAFLDERGRPWAVVGGLAMAAYGLPRTTLDLDVVVELAAQPDLVEHMEALGYETLHRSEGYSNHAHTDDVMGGVDFVYVRGETAAKLFAAVRYVPGPGGRPIPVPSPEHLAAMKVLAMRNDPARTFEELGDIRHLIAVVGADRQEIRRQFVRHDLEARFRELEATL
jgi:hypothetical protein